MWAKIQRVWVCQISGILPCNQSILYILNIGTMRVNKVGFIYVRGIQDYGTTLKKLHNYFTIE